MVLPLEIDFLTPRKQPRRAKALSKDERDLQKFDLGAVFGELKNVKVYAQDKRSSDIVYAELAAASVALSTLTNHSGEPGAGVAITRFWKAGNVAYAKIPALQGLDLNDFRGKAREEIRVSTS